MGIYLNSGNTAFKMSVNDDIYVDKSEIISFINSRIDKNKRYICVSRPRRFGKSMTAQMIAAYYDRGCDSRELFQNLKITKSETFEQHLNAYDVFFLNIQQFLSGAKNADNLVEYLEKEVLKEVKEVYSDYVSNNETSLPLALATIFAKQIKENKGFVFVIDEWDCVFREYQEKKEVQKQYLDFLKDLLKDRTYVKVVYMTGILPIKKYGTQSALNNFDEYTMLDPTPMEQYMGFTESEVQMLCKQYGMDFEKMNRWYDGYVFSDNMHIYSPKSVVDAICKKKIRNYWTSTETYEALQVYIDLDMYGLREDIISMLSNLKINIDTWAFQNDMTSLKSKDDVLTLLVHLGYLAYDEETSEVFIPNEEVRGEFFRAIKNGKRPEMIKAIQHSERLLEATIQRNEEEVARLIEEVHSANTSPNFYNNEQALRSIIQLAYISSMDDYVTIQELPSGIGYADLLFLPRKHSNKPAILIELKWDKSVKGAIGQIKNRNYVETIENYGGEILLVGINYNKKDKVHECIIEKYEKVYGKEGLIGE